MLIHQSDLRLCSGPCLTCLLQAVSDICKSTELLGLSCLLGASRLFTSLPAWSHSTEGLLAIHLISWWMLGPAYSSSKESCDHCVMTCMLTGGD